MAKLFLIAALLVTSLSAHETAYLWPQGDWQLCEAGIQMPGCIAGAPELYMLLTDSTAQWTITAVLESGQISVLSGFGQTSSLNFGGVVVKWSIVFRERLRR